MIIELILWVLFFIFSSFSSASVTYAIWWVTGQPQSIGDGTASYVEGRIFSHVGRRLSDWFIDWEKKENVRLKNVALDSLKNGEWNDNEFADKFKKLLYKVKKEQRKANPAKAFGVCPVCLGTYVSLFLSITTIVFLSVFASIWFTYLSPLVLVYHWAISLSFLQKIHLA